MEAGAAEAALGRIENLGAAVRLKLGIGSAHKGALR
jgi:hypothetical protein